LLYCGYRDKTLGLRYTRESAGNFYVCSFVRQGYAYSLLLAMQISDSLSEVGILPYSV
jgi:hypothetical protein